MVLAKVLTLLLVAFPAFAEDSGHCARIGAKAALRNGDGDLFLEHLRRRVVEAVEFSRAEADLIVYCHGGKGTPFHGWESTGEEAQGSLNELCQHVRETAGAQAKKLREFRILLSLMRPRFRSDLASPKLPLAEKLSPKPYALHTDIRPAPLTKDELEEAERRFDEFLYQAAKEKFPGFDFEESLKSPFLPRPSGFDSYLKYKLDAWRIERGKEAKWLLEQNPLLSHFSGAESGDAAIAKAAEHLQRKTGEFLGELASLNTKKRYANAALLFQLGGTVDAVLAEHPELCAGAEEAQSAVFAASTRKDILLAVAVPLAGSACTIITRLPIWCFGGAGTLAAGVHYLEVRREMRFAAKALDSAIDKDTSLIRALEELDAKDRELFIAGLLVLTPYEVALGNAWQLAERNTVFQRIVFRLGSSVRINGKTLFTRVIARLTG